MTNSQKWHTNFQLQIYWDQTLLTFGVTKFQMEFWKQSIHTGASPSSGSVSCGSSSSLFFFFFFFSFLITVVPGVGGDESGEALSLRCTAQQTSEICDTYMHED